MAFFRGSLLLTLLLVCCGLVFHVPATRAMAPVVKPAPVRLAPPAPRPRPRPTEYDRYVALAARNGLQVTRPTVLGLRGRNPVAADQSGYDDSFVVLLPERRLVKRFRGSTHAGQASSTLAPAGVALIQPGLYRALPYGDYAEMPCWLVLTRTGREALPCWRDADRDGLISVAEKGVARTADAILFHNGRYDDHPSSIGCQTMPPVVMRQFIASVGVHQEFDFLLLEAPVHG